MPIGKIETFDVNPKQWPAYVRRVNQFILLNEIKPELKVPTLITVVGDATYSLMYDLCAPNHPEDKSYEELVKLVTDHLEPQRSEIAERHIYRQRRQQPGETLTDYLQNLKHLASTCNFTGRLEEELRDQFVSGLASEAMRSRIFAEKQITYSQAVELALALEAAERHAARDLCNRRGHLKAMCPNSKRWGGEKGQHYLNDNSEDEFFNVQVRFKSNKPYFVNIEVDGVPLEYEIDTGSRISAISEECYKKIFKHKTLWVDNLVLCSYSGSRIEPLGFIKVRVNYKNIKVNDVHLYVIKEGGRPLLGRDWLSALQIGEIKLNQIVEDRLVSQLRKEFPEVFSDQLGTCTKTISLELNRIEKK